MTLSDRKKKILATVVRMYVITGEPVGSKALCELLGGVSSATIRNEMSELAESGYLDQPHTSAGRIPTDRAYRLYIDSLMQRHSLTENERNSIDALLPCTTEDSDRAVRLAVRSLSNATQCVAIATRQTDAGTVIHKVELIPMNSQTALIVLVTSTGEVKSRMFRLPGRLTDRLTEQFINLVNERLIGRELLQIQPAELQTAIAMAGEYALELTPLICALGELIDETGRADLEITGETRLLSCSEFSLAKAREVFELLLRRDEVLALLDTWNSESGVILGSDTSYTALDRSSMVLARYRIGGTKTGYIGIVGPVRMNYDTVLPSIEYFADALSSNTSKGLI